MPRPADMPTLRGLPNPNTTPLPNCIVDEYLPFFTGAELKVLLYLVRRTLGFHKTRDAISLNQICNGIVRKDGRRLDRGTGLHKSTACDALNALVGWGMIKRVTRRDLARGDLPTEYILWIEGESQEEAGQGKADDGGSSTAPPPNPAPPTAGRQVGIGVPRSETTSLPVSALSDTGDGIQVATPVSGRADTPLSVQQDTPVSDRADRQNLASQEKSNARQGRPEFAEEKRQSRAVSTAPADGLSVGSTLPTRLVTPLQSGDVSGQRSPDASPKDGASTFDPMREALHPFAETIAREFNDRASFRATLSRLVNLYHRAGLPMDVFAERLDAARQRTKERTAAIRPMAGGGAGWAAKNKMPYFFALLEEQLGFRDEATLPAAGPVRDGPAVRDTPPAVTRMSPPDETSEPARLEDAMPHRPPTPIAPTGTPTAAVADADERMIGAVVREFSHQFVEYAAAAALGDWAIALWRRTGLSRQRFLEVAGAVSDEMVRDRTTAASAPLFRAHLAAAFDQSAQDKGTGVRGGPKCPPPPPESGTAAVRRDGTSGPDRRSMEQSANHPDLL